MSKPVASASQQTDSEQLLNSKLCVKERLGSNGLLVTQRAVVPAPKPLKSQPYQDSWQQKTNRYMAMSSGNLSSFVFKPPSVPTCHSRFGMMKLSGQCYPLCGLGSRTVLEAQQVEDMVASYSA